MRFHWGDLGHLLEMYFVWMWDFLTACCLQHRVKVIPEHCQDKWSLLLWASVNYNEWKIWTHLQFKEEILENGCKWKEWTRVAACLPSLFISPSAKEYTRVRVHVTNNLKISQYTFFQSQKDYTGVTGHMASEMTLCQSQKQPRSWNKWIHSSPIELL